MEKNTYYQLIKSAPSAHTQGRSQKECIAILFCLHCARQLTVNYWRAYVRVCLWVCVQSGMHVCVCEGPNLSLAENIPRDCVCLRAAVYTTKQNEVDVAQAQRT